MAVSKCPCLTFSAAMSCLDAKISLVPSIVPYSTFHLIGSYNTHPNRQSHKATKIHTLRPLTNELFCFSKQLNNTRSADIFQDLGWDTPRQRRSKQLAISVREPLNNLYREDLKNVFKPISRVQSFNVRGASNNIFAPRPRTEAAQRAFS